MHAQQKRKGECRSHSCRLADPRPQDLTNKTKLTATFLPKRKMYVNLTSIHLKNRLVKSNLFTIIDPVYFFQNIAWTSPSTIFKIGYEIKHVHREITSKQGDFMRSWVQYCTKKRAAAKTEFEKSFWKLIVNAVYGKTIENVWDRKSVKICRSTGELLQAVSKKIYKRQIIFNEDLVILAHKKSMVYCDQPY